MNHRPPDPRRNATAQLFQKRIVMPRTTRRRCVQRQIQRTLSEGPPSNRHHFQIRCDDWTLILRFAALRYVVLCRKPFQMGIQIRTRGGHSRMRCAIWNCYRGNTHQSFQERTASEIRCPVMADQVDMTRTTSEKQRNGSHIPRRHSAAENRCQSRQSRSE